MRKILFVILLLLPLLFAADALGETRREVSYPGQEITLAVPAQYESFYRDNVGLTVIIREKDTEGYCRVQVLPREADFSPEDYLENVFIPAQRSFYVTSYDNWLLDEGETKVYSLGGRQMTGRTTLDNLAGKEHITLVALDDWNGMTIRYEMHALRDNPDAALLLLSGMIRCVTKHALAPQADTLSWAPLVCQEQGFLTAVTPASPRRADAENGLTVYTQKEGVIPYITVYQGRDLIAEAFAFIREQFTPHMKEKYGKDLITVSEYDRFLIGGKALPAGIYTYRVQDKDVVMVRIYDSTGRHTAVFTAKYIKGEGDATMMALDTAIANYRALN